MPVARTVKHINHRHCEFVSYPVLHYALTLSFHAAFVTAFRKVLFSYLLSYTAAFRTASRTVYVAFGIVLRVTLFPRALCVLMYRAMPHFYRHSRSVTRYCHRHPFLPVRSLISRSCSPFSSKESTKTTKIIPVSLSCNVFLICVKPMSLLTSIGF